MKLNTTIAHVTQRIAQRSLPTRNTYFGATGSRP